MNARFVRERNSSIRSLMEVDTATRVISVSRRLVA